MQKPGKTFATPITDQGLIPLVCDRRPPNGVPKNGYNNPTNKWMDNPSR
jgi:hypothetical protein